MANAPAKKMRIGFLSATIWKNETPTGSTFYSVELARTFKEGDDLKNTNALNHADLLNGARLLQKAEAWISEQ